MNREQIKCVFIYRELTQSTDFKVRKCAVRTMNYYILVITHVNTHANTYMPVHIHQHTYINTHVPIHIHQYTYVNTHTSIHIINTHMPTHIRQTTQNTCINKYTLVNIYKYAYCTKPSTTICKYTNHNFSAKDAPQEQPCSARGLLITRNAARISSS